MRGNKDTIWRALWVAVALGLSAGCSDHGDGANGSGVEHGGVATEVMDSGASDGPVEKGPPEDAQRGVNPPDAGPSVQLDGQGSGEVAEGLEDSVDDDDPDGAGTVGGGGGQGQDAHDGDLAFSDAEQGPDDTLVVDLDAVDSGGGDDSDTVDFAGDGADEEVADDAEVIDVPPSDIDGDTVPDDEDNCPEDPNPGQEDMDDDGEGDLCDADTDGDGAENEDDNCPQTSNPEQNDEDEDGIGDACEPDEDEDTVPDDDDNCPEDPNPDQADSDEDGIGDICEPDQDGDGIPDDDDNCPETANPDQKDTDGDGVGDRCEPDADSDGIPDDQDLFPDDSQLPGYASAYLLYPHTSSTLFSLHVLTHELTTIGNFQWPNDGGNHSMTDMAADRYGTLYGVSFTHLYTCHPQSAKCTSLGALPGSYNGLTMVPPGTLEPDVDVLVAIRTNGDWVRLDVAEGVVSATVLGSYGAGYSSSGDAYAIMGSGTYAAVNAAGSGADVLVSVNPLNGAVLGEISPIANYGSVYGLAGWSGRAYAFDSSGTVLRIDLTTGAVDVILMTNHSWWGAGVRTLL